MIMAARKQTGSGFLGRYKVCRIAFVACAMQVLVVVLFSPPEWCPRS
jgi:hypothetical protein